MGFEENPNIAHWKQGRSFNKNRDRLVVETRAEEVFVLAWSSEVNGLVLAPEAIPESISRYFTRELSDQYGYKLDPGEILLAASQQDDNCLMFRLIHPEFAGTYSCTYPVRSISSASIDRNMHSWQVSGKGYGVRPHHSAS